MKLQGKMRVAFATTHIEDSIASLKCITNTFDFYHSVLKTQSKFAEISHMMKMIFL